MNIFILVPFFSLIVSQIIKFIIETIKYKKVCLERLFNGSGGMPSTHSAFVSSLTTLIYIYYGSNSLYFAISFIFSLIIIYDSVGVRYESGKHAEIINIITNNKNKLKEKLDNTLPEVICGIILGIMISLIYYFC